MNSTEIYGQRYQLGLAPRKRSNRVLSSFPAGDDVTETGFMQTASLSDSSSENLKFIRTLPRALVTFLDILRVLTVLASGLAAGLLVKSVLPAIAFAFLLLFCASAVIGPEKIISAAYREGVQLLVPGYSRKSATVLR